MWSKEPHPTEYPVTGRILNRHKRGRPKFKLWQRLKSRGTKALIPLGVFGVIGLLVWFLDQMGVI